MIYCWSVPISSSAPHLAHLIVVGDPSYRACNRRRVIVWRNALAVDSALYRPKCKICLRAQRRADVQVTRRTEPWLRTSADVTRHRWSDQRRRP